MQEGSYVICINDSNWGNLAFKKLSALPVKGKVYQVRRFIPNFDTCCNEDGIALEGIFGDWDIYKINSNKRIYEEFHFRISRFREIENPILIEDVLEKEEVCCEG
jgi:hypothetical protein